MGPQAVLLWKVGAANNLTELPSGTRKNVDFLVAPNRKIPDRYLKVLGATQLGEDVLATGTLGGIYWNPTKRKIYKPL